MSEDEKQEKGFKVTDRRAFTAEGEPRESAAPHEEEAERAETAEQAPSPRAEPRAPATERSGGHEAQFLDVLGLLATQASLALGEPHPVSGERSVDLDAARVMISMIEVLQKKTAGNLTKEEEAALDEILYTLRSVFVARTRGDKK